MVGSRGSRAMTTTSNARTARVTAIVTVHSRREISTEVLLVAEGTGGRQRSLPPPRRPAGPERALVLTNPWRQGYSPLLLPFSHSGTPPGEPVSVRRTGPRARRAPPRRRRRRSAPTRRAG